MIRRIVLVGVAGTGVLVFGIVILIGVGSNNNGGCGGGPSTAGQPPMIQYYILAAQAAGLGPDGYAYLAGINNVESNFDASTLPGVHSGANAYGAAGPMQIGIGGASGNTWGGLAASIPADLPGGVAPPSVYNNADAIYAAAFYLKQSGAPANWPGAIFAYNHAGWYVSEVSGYAQSYLGANGLQTLTHDIASHYGGGQPSRLVGLASTTSTPTTGTGTGTGTTTAPATSSGSCGAVDAQGYANPFGKSHGLTPLRIDMGVDYTASGPIDAVGNGTITYAQAQGTGWGPYSCSGGGAGAVVEQLSDGSEKGKWVNIAEGITPTVSSGTVVQAGQQIGMFVGCIEIGWADGPGPSPRAADLRQNAAGSSAGDAGSYSTGCGEDMNSLLIATGLAAGLQRPPIQGSGC